MKTISITEEIAKNLNLKNTTYILCENCPCFDDSYGLHECGLNRKTKIIHLWDGTITTDCNLVHVKYSVNNYSEYKTFIPEEVELKIL